MIDKRDNIVVLVFPKDNIYYKLVENRPGTKTPWGLVLITNIDSFMIKRFCKK